ncbi:OmpA family protein [Parvularcula sp. IMCC14364]|uniref:OmpA family protein n=1 Tax=Parvularcula sp. IMCC14364 TaxID=3067902 RepID=UPI002740CECA|nr:OmpA family protein [Parvularcula sp. IMCC14364]
MKLKLALLAAAGSLALGSVAHAGDGSWYTALGAGYTFSNDENDFESNTAIPGSSGTPGSATFGFNTDYDLDEALNLYGAIGKKLSNGHRAEVEFATRTQTVDSFAAPTPGFGGIPSDGDLGDVTVNTLMFNVYKDLDFSIGSRVNPYIGAGIGLARMRSEVNNVNVTGGALAQSTTDPYTVVVADGDNAVAYQAMAGLVFDLAENLDFDVRYKYLLTGEFDYDGFVNGPLTSLDSEFEANELTAGFRWTFGAPAPVATPAPRATVTYKNCPDGSRIEASLDCPAAIVEEVVAPKELGFTVYFDYDKSNLSDAARRVINERTSEALQYDIADVDVAGNTDTSGSSAYNNALSARRAAVVRDALVANGVSGGLIDVAALGENNLAKPTADGVREPLNRRTDVEFTFDN